jgi:hypothetical protein
MDSKVPARRNTAVQLFEGTKFTKEELDQLKDVLGERNVKYIRDQYANLGVLSMAHENLEFEIKTARVKRDRTPEHQQLKTLEQDKRAIRERAQNIVIKQLGVLESALKSVRKSDPMYKKILLLVEPLREQVDGGAES